VEQSHIIHPIGFVHDYVRHTLQRQDLTRMHGKNINQSPRRRHDDVRTALEVRNLFRDSSSTIDGSGSVK
jgi:hypothetical protein